MSKSSSCVGCPRLKLVPEAKEALQERNFWNTCPRQLDSLPDEPCSLGKPLKNKKGRVIAEPECPWWIDSEEHNFCFWRYIHANSLPNGKMDSLLQNEIAQLFGCSSTKVHFIVKEAVQKLKNSSNLGVLADLAGSGDRDADGTAPVPEGFNVDPEPEYSDSDDEP